MSEFIPGAYKKGPSLVPKDAEIQELKLQDLARGQIPTYQAIKNRFRADLNTKSSRFSLSELVSNQLSVELEEQKRFDRKVSETVEQKIKQIREDAYKEGVTSGTELGKAQAYEEEKARLAKALEEMAMATKTILLGKEKLADQYEKALVDVAFKMARFIVHREVTDRPELISKTIEAILQKIAKDDDVRIRLSHQEYDAIAAIQADVKQMARTGNLNFELDQDLAPGDCVVESLSGEIGSFIDEKFAKLSVELSNSLKQKFERTGS